MNTAPNSFTVIVPTFRRPEALLRCLEALRGAPDVVVSDDAGDPEIRELVNRCHPNARWTAAPGRGPAANRNHGARMARSEWLAFTDDDCVPQPGWIEALAASVEGADVIEGCTCAPGASDSPFEEHVENMQGGVLWSCNLAVRRETFFRLGGFDEDFRDPAGEDMEFAWRVARAGWRVRFAPSALVHHPPRRIGWSGLWRRTWMIRWMSLYRIKTGQARSLPAAAGDEIALLFRLTVQLVTRADERWPRRQYFAVTWRWLTFPLVLPYVLYWNWRFIRMRSGHVSGNATP
jgi:GT2 family glycosyltransferase